MPKFKYTPKKENLLHNTIKQNEDENIGVENTPQIKPFNTEITSNIKPQPFPQQNIKPQSTETIKDIDTKKVEEEIEIPDFLNIENTKSNDIDKEINTKPKTNIKINIPFNKFKLNKKLIMTSLSVVLVIALVIGIVNIFNSKTEYTISSQDLIATYSNSIEEGALIDIKNSVPLNLSIRDFNIAVPEKDEITLSLWDFTDTNKNKVTIYVNGEIIKSDIVFTKKVTQIKVPADAKVEIMQTETTNSPYTPYALAVNGVTYFNRLSSEKTNTYQFIKMEEKENLSIEDFNQQSTEDITEEVEE